MRNTGKQVKSQMERHKYAWKKYRKIGEKLDEKTQICMERKLEVK